MKKHARRLTLNRETILRLDDSALRGGAAVAALQDTQPESPLCGPTYWESCEPCATA